MMKTLVITIPDHIEAAIEAKASHTGRAAAELAADMLGSAVGGTDWSDELDDDARASVREGMADIERGAVREHEAVFELLNMKQMTITLSGALSAAVEEKAAYLGRSAADLVAEAVAHAFLPDDWLDSLSDEDKAAIEEGRAQIERGEGSPHDEVMERLYRKYGW